MNPMTNIKNLLKLNERELELGIIGKKSWHDEYKDSAWIFVGGLPYDLTEGDIVCVFSQYGEIVNINLVRDSKTGKSKGYAFICYQDQRSTVLAVDNLNGIKILGRTIRVDHVKDYKMPKERGDEDELTIKLRQEGCAPKIDPPPQEMTEIEEKTTKPKKKKEKKTKKEKKKKKRKENDSSQDEDSVSSRNSQEERLLSQVSNMDYVKKEKFIVKEEKMDNSYDKAVGRLSTTAEVTCYNSTDGGESSGKRIYDNLKQNDMTKNGVKGCDRRDRNIWNSADCRRYRRGVDESENREIESMGRDRQIMGSKDGRAQEREFERDQDYHRLRDDGRKDQKYNHKIKRRYTSRSRSRERY